MQLHIIEKNRDSENKKLLTYIVTSRSVMTLLNVTDWLKSISVLLISKKHALKIYQLNVIHFLMPFYSNSIQKEMG